MTVFRALVLRPILRERMRTMLTLLGIAVGVAVVVAIQLANQSALRAFRESIDAVAGRANYQIVADAPPLDENVLVKLQPLWQRDVRFAPVIDVEGVLEPQQLPIRILGVDLLSDLHFRDYRYARVATRAQSPLAYFELFREDSVIIPEPLAREQHLALGSTMTLNVLGHRKPLVVRGILEAKGPATAFNGAIAVVDVATAQKAFGMLGKVTRIDVIAADSVAPAIAKLLPPATRIERPARRGERVEKMLRAFRVNLFALAGVALLVGMFLVYNTVLISILRRRKDVGVLKTVGVSPRQVFGAFLGEGLLFGAAGSALGIALGLGLATAILGLIGRTINALYVTSRPEGITLTPGIIVTGIAVGTLLSLISALQPSLEAAAVRPNALIRPGLQQSVSRASGRVAFLASLACFAAAALVSRLPAYRGIAVAGYVAVLLVVAAFSLLAPAIVRGTAALSTPPLRRLFGIAGGLAGASLPASLRRTSIASAALSVAIGMMVAVALMVGSFRETVRIWVDQTVSSDLWLRPSKGLTNGQIALFPPELADEVARVPFVQAVDRVRGRNVLYGDAIVSVGSGDFAIAQRYGDLPMVAPRSAANALGNAIRSNGVFVSETFSLKYDKNVGDVVALPTAHGIRRFPITGVYRDYSNDRGVVVMDRKLFVSAFDDRALNTVVVYLKRGVKLEDARVNLEAAFGPKYHAFAVTNGEIRHEVMTIFDQTFLITYALLGIAIVVAVLGIVNTLAALIIERQRELALLRVLGMSRAELRRMIVLESSMLGLASTVVGLAMGYVLSFILIFVINKQSFGWTIEFHTPARLIAGSLAITFLAAATAGLLPARLAQRIELATALKNE
jgi:putative ABC transport system permease protein